MSPTIRIDDEVWDWLKGQARPFEDTPNSVIRRVAGLDPPLPPDVVAMPMTPSSNGTSITSLETGQAKEAVMRVRLGRRVTGESLNREHRLGVRQALYHKDGTWYHVLTTFPAALCDPHGYIRYEDEHQFRSDPYLEIGEHTNIRSGLGGHPRYKRFR